MKNSVEGHNSRMEHTEVKLLELKDRTIKMI